MTIDLDILEMLKGQDYFMPEMKYWIKFMILIAFLALIGGFLKKYYFGILAENVTFRVRKDLYSSILQKNIGWHDDRDNGSSVLTSAIAQDTTLLNGVASDTIGTQMDANFALLTGIGIGLGFCWQEALICIALSPLMIIG